MCFSPEADLVGGLLISGVGVDVLTHVRGPSRYRALAALPLLLGAHQLVESLVWWGADGSVPHALGRLALWLYLLFAFVVLPTYVPWAVWRIEPHGPRRRLMAVLTGAGLVASAALLAAMLEGPVAVEAHEHHLAYSTGLRAGGLVVALYLLVTCGAFLLSGERVIAGFGAVNTAAVVVISVLVLDGFASVWCAWAAVTAAVFALHARRVERDSGPSRVVA